MTLPTGSECPECGDHIMVCGCPVTLTDEQVAAIKHIEAHVAREDYKDRYGEYPDMSEFC